MEITIKAHEYFDTAPGCAPETGDVKYLTLSDEDGVFDRHIIIKVDPGTSKLIVEKDQLVKLLRALT